MLIGPLGIYFRKINQDTKFFIHENAYENVVCEMTVTVSRERWLNMQVVKSMRQFAMCWSYTNANAEVHEDSLGHAYIIDYNWQEWFQFVFNVKSNWILFLFCSICKNKNIVIHTARTIVSLPNPKQL